MPLAPLYTVRGTAVPLRSEPQPLLLPEDAPADAFGPAAVFERTPSPSPDEEALTAIMQRYRAAAGQGRSSAAEA